jgi:hypothetical protein
MVLRRDIPEMSQLMSLSIGCATSLIRQGNKVGGEFDQSGTITNGDPGGG